MQNDTKQDNFFQEKDHEIEDVRPTVRFQAVKILNRYERSAAYIDKLLANSFQQYDFSKQDRSLLTEIVYGTVRWKSKLDWVLTGFFHGDFNKCINPIKNTMRIGLYQILILDKVPDHAAINESVEIAKRIQSQKTAGLVNGVLRNIARNVNNIRYPNPSQDENFYKSVIFSYPKWMLENWMQQFGVEGAEEIMNAMNERPGVAIRLNRLRYADEEARKDFVQRAENLGYKLRDVPGVQGSFYLDAHGENIGEDDFYSSGDWTVQDPSSALVGMLASPQKGQYIADICAAPGGKTTLMGELMGNEGKLIAFDKFEAKLEQIQQNLDRMGVSIAKTVQADATKITIKGTPDIILADVPCSGTGTIQKHPEIKWALEKDSIKNLVKTQREIMLSAASQLSKGGVLIYSTCSIEAAENRENIDWFLSERKDFELEDAGEYIDKRFVEDACMTVYPHKHGMMGAFAARLRKK